MIKVILLFLLVFLVSCSTVDRRSYYSPSSSIPSLGHLHEPKDIYEKCGMAQFGKEPDSITFYGLIYSSNQRYEPYFWGPWLITVVPIFPITWIVDAFSNPKLEISISGAPGNYDPRESDIAINVTLSNGSTEALRPELFKKEGNIHIVVFPVNAKDVESFSLPVNKNETKVAEIRFNKTSRWSWTQYCIN